MFDSLITAKLKFLGGTALLVFLITALTVTNTLIQQPGPLGLPGKAAGELSLENVSVAEIPNIYLPNNKTFRVYGTARKTSGVYMQMMRVYLKFTDTSQIRSATPPFTTGGTIFIDHNVQNRNGQESFDFNLTITMVDGYTACALPDAPVLGVTNEMGGYRAEMPLPSPTCLSPTPTLTLPPGQPSPTPTPTPVATLTPTLTLTPPGGWDLTVTSLQADSLPPGRLPWNACENIPFTYLIKNLGPQTSPNNVPYRFVWKRWSEPDSAYRDILPAAFRYLPGMQNQEEATFHKQVNFNQASGGDFQVRIFIDPENQMSDERDRTNNHRGLLLQSVRDCPTPTLTLTPTFTPTPPPGATATPTPTVPAGCPSINNPQLSSDGGDQCAEGIIKPNIHWNCNNSGAFENEVTKQDDNGTPRAVSSNCTYDENWIPVRVGHTVTFRGTVWPQGRRADCSRGASVILSGQSCGIPTPTPTPTPTPACAKVGEACGPSANNRECCPVPKIECAVPPGSSSYICRIKGEPAAKPLSRAADLNGDGKVDVKDASILMSSWGKRSGQPGFNPKADINKDGIVNALDASILMRAWGARF